MTAAIEIIEGEVHYRKPVLTETIAERTRNGGPAETPEQRGTDKPTLPDVVYSELLHHRPTVSEVTAVPKPNDKPAKDAIRQTNFT